MRRRIKNGLLAMMLGAVLAAGPVGCTPTNDTITALVDLAASSAGGLVQILVSAALNAILTAGQSGINLGLPISQQVH